MKTFQELFLLFIIYSFLGWILETLWCSVQEKKLANRGFLIGPIIPIYGFGSILIVLLLNKYTSDILALFILSVVVCCILEYNVSLLMEKLFKTRWWDYSKRKFNINGRVCLSNAICFGFLGVLLLYFLNPFFVNLISKLSPFWFNFLFLILFILILIDFITSLVVVSKFTKTAKLVKKDSSNDINTKVKELLLSQSFLYKRLVNAYPNFEIKIKEIKEKINNIKNS